jgi:hypothetical protein
LTTRYTHQPPSYLKCTSSGDSLSPPDGSLGDSCLLDTVVTTRICKKQRSICHLIPLLSLLLGLLRFTPRLIFFFNPLVSAFVLAVKSFSSCAASNQSESSTPAAIGPLRHIHSLECRATELPGPSQVQRRHPSPFDILLIHHYSSPFD